MFETGISNNGIIVINRGDTFSMPISINIGTDANPDYYILTGEDKIYFSICEPNQDFNDGVVRKILTAADETSEGDLELVLQPSDTQNILPGTYYYEVKLRIVNIENDIVKTIIPRRKLIIC